MLFGPPIPPVKVRHTKLAPDDITSFHLNGNLVYTSVHCVERDNMKDDRSKNE
jgi:hypothetical protein